MKCALYARVSTREQASDGESLNEQITKMEAYCSYQGITNWDVYREEGYSGKDTKRPEFQRMMAGVEKGEIQAVIVKKIDRLSRSIIDFENIYNYLESKGVTLNSLNESFDTSTAIGRAAIRIILVFAQLEREQISERTKDVMAHRALQGFFNGGYPRLGFDLVDNRLVVNKAEALIVNEIFKSYLQKGSLSKTAMELNSKGYRMKSWTTQKGELKGAKEFSKSNLLRILHDPAYIGNMKYKDQTFEGTHETIIEKDVFNAVQAMLNTNLVTKTGFRESGDKFLLRGLITCGACKSAMTSSFSLSKGKEYHYYRCTSDTDKSKQKCHIGSVNSRNLEQLVIDELKAITENQDLIDKVVERALHEQGLAAEEWKAKKKVLRDQLSQTDKKITNLLSVIESQGSKTTKLTAILEDIDALHAHSAQLKNEIENIDLQICAAEQDIFSAETVRGNLKIFREVFDHLTPDEQHDLLHLLVKKIVYYEDKDQAADGSKSGKIKMELWELPELSKKKPVL